MAAAEGETWGLLQASKWAILSNLSMVIFEMDCRQVVDDIYNEKSDVSEYGCLLEECRTILFFQNNYKVVFARRQTNGSVHALTRTSISYAPRTIFHSAPICFWNIIMK